MNQSPTLAKLSRYLASPLLLVFLVILNFWPTFFHGFVWDDHGYVSSNYHIQSRNFLEVLKWAFSSFSEANWHPLTWIALHLEFRAFGFDPAGYHATNVALHAINAILIYLILLISTGYPGRSVFIAAIFAVHPQRIESVAWITEIKDVLSIFFMLLSMLVYIRLHALSNFTRMTCVAIFMALGLMAKPMPVTLPFLLLLFDYWPLKRILYSEQSDYTITLTKSILEKIPLFALSVASCIITYYAQSSAGAVADFISMPTSTRLANMMWSYFSYAMKTVWPTGLTFFYTYELHPPLWKTITATTFLIGTCVGVWKGRRACPAGIVGWLWFLGTLVPVIGIIQVGSQSMADRYTYFPSIGLILALTWAAADYLKHIGSSLLLPAVSGSAVVFWAMISGFDYVRHWKDDQTLYEHAISVNIFNPVAHYNLAHYYRLLNQPEKAIPHAQKVIEMLPNKADAYNILALSLSDLGQTEDALAAFNKALEINPRFDDARSNLGLILMQHGRIDEARFHLEKAVADAPHKAGPKNNLAGLYLSLGDDDAALSLYSQAKALMHEANPLWSELINNIGVVLLRQGKTTAALDAFSASADARPDYLPALQNRGLALIELGLPEEAAAVLKSAVRLSPNNASSQNLMGMALYRSGHNARAYSAFKKAVSLNLSNADTHNNYGMALKTFGQLHAARRHFQEAIRLNPDHAGAKTNLAIIDAFSPAKPLNKP